MSFLHKEDEFGVVRPREEILKNIQSIILSLGWEILFTDMVLGRVQVKVPGFFGSQTLTISIDKIDETTSKIKVTTEMGLMTFDPDKMRKTINRLHKAVDAWSYRKE
jgi:hypothetical protein